MPRLLKPNEYDALRKQFKATPDTFAEYFTRDAKGGIYLKDAYDPSVTPQDGQGQAQPQAVTQDRNAELWSMLNGGKAAENPYIPYLTPRVVTGADGKKFLRIPKNQALLDVAKFFDERGQTQYKNTSDFVNDFLGYQNADQKLALDTAKTQYDINKPYSGGGSGTKTKDRKLTITEAAKLGVPIGTMLSEVEGQQVPSGNTATFNNFVKDANLNVGGMSRDPRVAYQDYREAQQLIDQDPAKFNQIRNDPKAAPFAHLLKPKQSNDLYSLFSGLFGGQEVNTSD